MREISGLNDYLKIICDRQSLVDYVKSSDNTSDYLSRTNDIIKEYSMLVDNLDKIGTNKRSGIREIQSFIEQYYEYIYSFKQRTIAEKSLNSQEKSNLSFFYRGVSNSSHKIAPGIYRKTERHEENYYFNEISVRCPEAFRSFGNLEKLTYMQHYGCPTRLLDITSNPLVALYFSCLGNEEENGVVYIFAVNESDVLYANSDRIQMLSKLAEFKKTEQMQLRVLSYINLAKDKFPKSGPKYQNSIVERYYHAIKRNNGAFERDIIPFDILKPQFVQPNKDNPRILKQDGAFIISGLDMDYQESDMKIRKYIVNELVIPPWSKHSILRELEYVGINQATLFPEVEKVADYLRHRQ